MNKNEKFEKLRALKPEKMDYSDRGTSELFAELFKDEIVYNTTMKEWYYYNTKFWEVDAGAMRISTLAKEFYDLLMIYVDEIINNADRKNYYDYYKRYGSKIKRDILIRDAASNCYISASDFDKNAELFNCENGTLNLKTFEFRKYRSEDYITKIANVIYNPDAKSDEWEKFTSEIMCDDVEKMHYLQKAVGYAISGECNLEQAFILFGASTRNGKSTFVNTISTLLGGTSGYARNAQPELLQLQRNKKSSSANEDLARLVGCRFLSVSEPPQNMALDVALLKTLTGRDKITARFLYANSFEFTPCFTLFINTNHLPKILDDTVFKSDRLNVIEFTKHFCAEEQDIHLKDKLITTENLSGIFNWCLNGLRSYRVEGLNKPDSIIESTDNYNKESDKLTRFIEECLEPEEGIVIAIKELYKLYIIWCNNNGYATDSKQKFIAELKKRKIFAMSGTVEGKTVRNVIKDYRLAA
ncbi:MAG: phage/plasmid primase, P4 family [Oscillospiraceae bacterium]